MTGLALTAVLLLSEASAAGDSARQRAWPTGVGLGIAGPGSVALCLAAWLGSQSAAAGRIVAAYYANGAAPTAAEASTVRWLRERSENASSQSLALLISGAVAVGVGITLVALDGSGGRASLTVTAGGTGASAVFSGSF